MKITKKIMNNFKIHKILNLMKMKELKMKIIMKKKMSKLMSNNRLNLKYKMKIKIRLNNRIMSL